ncbi:flagellar hook-length control protein FliK [Vibrio sp. TBV020]|uniref:flagellar hook-length control protein FliK n=1 Tax=Vibrio sp. TBV020 TaxID=3137398 RepID=UPI0038CD47F1
MNINLSSVSESPKVAKSVASGEEVATEASESGGFFSKLAAMIKGEGKAEGETESVKSVSNEGDSEVSVEGDAEVSEAKLTTTESQSTDELLASENESAEKKASVESESDSDKPAATTKSVDAEGKAETSQSASKIVSENDEVLQRLNESNNALKPKDGKELPQESDIVQGDVKKEAVALTSSQSPDNELEGVKLEGKQQAASTMKPEPSTQTVVSADGEEVAVPKAAAPFIQQQQASGTEQPLESDSSDTAPVAVATSAGVIAANTTDVAEAGESVEHVAQKVSSEELIQPQSDDAIKLENGSAAEPAVAAGAAAVVAASVATSNKTTPQAKVSNDDAQTQIKQGDTVASQALTEGDLDPNMAAAAPVAAAAIPWAASAENVATDEVAINLDGAPKAQQAAVAQSVQQALGHQQAQVAQSALQTQSVQQAASAIPADLAAMQMQQVAAAPNVAMTQDQALLKAAMGAKAAGTIGQLAKSSEGQQAGQESGFAQQLSQAAGAQGTNSLSQARADQVAAQAPLQLTREMASEQVAERVQMMMSKNLKNIDIRLDPPELGRMQIRMNMNGDGATVHFTVANQQARDVIEQSMPRLREMLAQQGVQLNDSSVQQQASGQQQKGYAAAGQGQNGQGNSNQGVQGEENLEADINLDLNVAAKRDGISYYA